MMMQVYLILDLISMFLIGSLLYVLNKRIDRLFNMIDDLDQKINKKWSNWK
jgi:hypothetical protein